jgi:hypothetical protein
VSGNGKRPVYRITFARKDGEEVTFQNYKGDEVTKKYAPLGALFARDKGAGFSFAVDSSAVSHELDPEKFWYNVYPVEDSKDDAPRSGGGGARQGRGRQQSRKDDSGDDLSY